MAPEKARKNPGKIEVPTETLTEFNLKDTAAGMQRRREEGEEATREGEGQKVGATGENSEARAGGGTT